MQEIFQVNICHQAVRQERTLCGVCAGRNGYCSQASIVECDVGT